MKNAYCLFLTLTVLNVFQDVYSQIHYVNTADEVELYSAYYDANNGDTIMFSLPSYPAIINISGGFYINKKITIIGSTTEKIILEGASDELGGSQLFNISSSGGDLTLKYLTLTRQSGGADNGGQSLIWNMGNLKIFNSLLHNVIDSTTQGSIIYNGWDGYLHIENSTFSNNFGGQGGAIYSTGELTIISSTFYNNFADNVGGGIFWHANGGGFTSSNSLYYNSSCYKYSRIINSMGYNASNDLTYNFNDNNDYNNVQNIYLETLEDNGGATYTHSLNNGSIAIDNGDPSIMTSDQRGMPVYNGRRDIGSFEKQNSNKTIFITNEIFNEEHQAIIPVSVSQLSISDNIISYQFDIDYDNTVLEYTGTDLAGTLADGGNTSINSDVSGKLNVSYMTSTALVGAGDILLLQFNTLKADTTAVTISNAYLNATEVTDLSNGTVIVKDVTPPTAEISYDDTENRCGDELLITATFGEPMLESNAVKISMSGGAVLTNADMTRVSPTVYTYNYTIPNSTGNATISLSNGTDLWGNEITATPTSGDTFSIIPIIYGDVDDNGVVMAYDAALTLQHSVGIDPLPLVDPLPWENWRDTTANVDRTAGITANDAGLILQFSTGKITDFTSTKKSVMQGFVSVQFIDYKIVFLSYGDLIGLNVSADNENQILGEPVVLADDFMLAKNIKGSTYRIGICTSSSPADGTQLMEIPVLNDGQITIDMVVNNDLYSMDLNLLTDIESSVADRFMLYPNPAKDVINISGILTRTTASIYDINGKLVISKEISSTESEISVTGLTSGMYVIKLQEDNQVYVKRFVIE